VGGTSSVEADEPDLSFGPRLVSRGEKVAYRDESVPSTRK
jgi:hypothetical protein